MTHPDTLQIPRAVVEQAIENLTLFCSKHLTPKAWSDTEKLSEALRAALQPQAAEACPTCGTTEPYTGSCGTSDGDTKALCKRKPQAAAAVHGVPFEGPTP